MNDDIKAILDYYVTANKGNDYENIVNKIASDIREVLKRDDLETIDRLAKELDIKD